MNPDNKKRKETAEKLAKKFFSDQENLPSADMMLRALAIAKGTTFSIDADQLQELKTKASVQSDDCLVIPGDSCVAPRDVCWLCDHPNDNCNLCDWEDCGLGPDPGPT